MGQTVRTIQTVRENPGTGTLSKGPVHAVMPDMHSRTWCGRKMRQIRALRADGVPVERVTCGPCARALAKDQPRAYRKG